MTINNIENLESGASVRGKLNDVISEVNSLGTIATQNSNNVSITGGTGAFTTLSASTSLTTPLITRAGTLALSATGANVITASTNGVERMRIASNGNVGIGTSSPITLLHIIGVQDIPEDGLVRIQNNHTTTGGEPTWGLGITRQNSPVRALLLGSDNNNHAAFAVNGNFASIFGKSTSGTFTEHMRIDSAGNVGIGTTSPERALHIVGTSVADSRVRVTRSGASGETGIIDNDLLLVALGSNGSNGGVRVFAGGNEKVRIRDNGRVGIGTGNPDELLHVTDIGKFDTGFFVGQSKSLSSADSTTRFVVAEAGSDTRLWQSSNTNEPMFFMQRPNSTGEMIRFTRQTSVVGSISIDTSSTSYNTSSDYRLKENVTPLSDATDRLMQIPVRRFNFIADPDTVVDGFLAHEVQPYVPEAVTGEKDAVDKDGNPEYQGIDQSKLVPLLTAALQDALKRIEALEAQLNP